MKITIVDMDGGKAPIDLEFPGRAYIDFNPISDSRDRKPGELVLANGYIKFDADSTGFISGIEVGAADPHSLDGELWSFIQDKNPLKQ